MANKKEEQLVRYFKQSNSIIEAKYKLKYVEKCVFAKAYMMVEEKDLSEPHKTYRIYIKDLIKDFGLSNDGLTYKNVRDWARELRKKELTFPYIDDEGNVKTIYSGFFTSVITSNEIDETTRDAYIEVEFDRRLKPYLLAAKKYTLFNQKRYEYICSKLHNATIIRLYEILKQYYRINAEHSEKWFNIQELKEILGVAENYALYGSFKQKVILLAQQRFLQYADIRFEFIEKKKGKAISEIKFSIHQNLPTEAPEWVRNEVQREMQNNKERRSPRKESNNEPENIVLDPQKLLLFNELASKSMEIGISENVLRMMIEIQDAEMVRHGLAYTAFEWGRGKVKENLDGYFISAVKGQFTNAAFEKSQKTQAVNAEKDDATITKTTLKKQIDALKDSIYDAQNDIIKELVAQDPSVTSHAIEQSIEKINVTPRLGAYVRKKGWDLGNLDLSIWRKDDVLRQCVIEAIVSQNNSHFDDLKPLYDQLRQLERLMKGER